MRFPTPVIARTLVLAALIPAAGCRSDAGDGATAKTIDNLTRADRALVENKCGVYLTPASVAKFSAADTAKLGRISAHSTAAALEATGAFMAVPKPIQSLFFAAGGTIRVVVDPTPYCTGAVKSPDQKAFSDAANGSKLDACWDVYDGKLEVIVRDNEAAVHHALVRTFGYVYTQFFAGNMLAAMAASDPKAAASVSKGYQRFQAQRIALGKALLQDLKKSPKATQAKYAAMAKSSANDYANFVLTDAIDSYYCSPDTRASFKASFPLTWKAFTEGQLAVTTDLGQPFTK